MNQLSNEERTRVVAALVEGASRHGASHRVRANVAISGMKFFYHQILGWDEQKLFLPPRKGSWRLPEVFSPKELELDCL